MRKPLILLVPLLLIILLGFTSVYAQGSFSASNHTALTPTASPNFKLTATAIIEAVTQTEAAGGANTTTDDPFELTATQIIVGATGTAAANQLDETATPTARDEDELTEEVQSIAVGDTLRDELPASGRARYTFDYNGDGLLEISARSEELDMYLQVYDEGGHLLAEDDDSGEGTDALLSAFAPPSSGTYTLIVSTYETINNSFNAINSSIVTDSFEVSIMPVRPTAIAYGDRIEDTLLTDVALFSFRGEANDVVTIRLESEAFDPVLTLQYDGEEVAYNDDFGSLSLNAQIDSFTLPENGVYIIHAARFGTESGPYTLILREGSSRPAPAAENHIRYGSNVTSNLPPERNTAVYTFQGERGDLISARLESSAFDPVLSLAENGIEIVEDDDSAGNLNALIDQFVLPRTGTYTLTVERYDESGSSGVYTLSLSRITLLPLTADELALFHFAPTEVEKILTFEGEAGTRIALTITADAMQFNLQSPSGGILAEGNTSQPPPQIQALPLPEDGTYQLHIRRADSKQNGAVSMLLETLSPLALTEGENAVQLRGSSQLFTLETRADEAIELAIRPQPDTPPPLQMEGVVQLNGEVIGSFAFTGGTASYTFTPDERGTATIFFSASPPDAALVITLVRNPGE